MSADGVPAWARIGFGLDRGRLLLPSPTQRTFLCILFILSLSVAHSLAHSLPSLSARQVFRVVTSYLFTFASFLPKVTLNDTE